MIENERRVRRSNVPTVALQCLLEAQKSRASLDAISIADKDGFLVASASSASFDCEVLAAVAPNVASGGHGIDSYNRETVSVVPFEVSGQTLYVAMRGGDRSMYSLVAKLGAEGAKRILS
ncbi:MAG: hypothetical protein JNK05_40620 [Myxococcales bacterium]|nr:hypothetical protein [Myxococcales bacterium]